MNEIIKPLRKTCDIASAVLAMFVLGMVIAYMLNRYNILPIRSALPAIDIGAMALTAAALRYVARGGKEDGK